MDSDDEIFKDDDNLFVSPELEEEDECYEGLVNPELIVNAQPQKKPIFHSYLIAKSIFVGDLIYSWYRNKRNKSILKKTIENGTRPDVGVSREKLVSRDDVVNCLNKILKPNEDQSFYHVICGEHGSGKTTLMKISSNNVKNGVIYVEIPSDTKDFGKAFGKALNFEFEEHISFTKQLIRKMGNTNNTFEEAKWKRALGAFKHVAKVYKAKHGVPPIIIYDNISQLAHKNPDILDILQDDAKNNADTRKYIAVFVSSEGMIPKRMECRSSWSRAEPVMEIGDLSKEESIKYLTDVRKVKEAERLYKIAGGLIVDLKFVADKSIAGLKYEDIKQIMLSKVKKKFESAKLLRNQSRHEIGKRVINVLLDSKEIDTDIFREFFKDNEFDDVLKENVFAYHPSRGIGGTVTFQSQSVVFYVQENAELYAKLIVSKKLQPPIKQIL
ncbi:hypothetical protein Glove_30g138 [Diversispora epigaea]|uniref:ATPase domain-containing protein n=1 Tax=Diversispora epigaea TaxID=1348612 RepID=A0A397JHA7_9GLOM|nr:hypothetical protein Glove_30g138 [Diversispora epigaea]